ncbi:MAG: hypothetical protein J6Z43_07185 [Clostridiales bacterium]|nr:hypothetical protein [Clostridiales bacterium]
MDLSSLVHNDPDSVRYRRNRGNLSVIGAGIIAFAGWNTIKNAIESFVGSVDNLIAEAVAGAGPLLTMAVTHVVVVILLFDILLRVYVGFCAITESRGRKTGRGYIVMTIILIIGSLFSVLISASEIIDLSEALIRTYVTFFFDLISLFLLVEMLIITRALRKKRREGIVHAA